MREGNELDSVGQGGRGEGEHVCGGVKGGGVL